MRRRELVAVVDFGSEFEVVYEFPAVFLDSGLK